MVEQDKIVITKNPVRVAGVFTTDKTTVFMSLLVGAIVTASLLTVGLPILSAIGAFAAGATLTNATVRYCADNPLTVWGEREIEMARPATKVYARPIQATAQQPTYSQTYPARVVAIGARQHVVNPNYDGRNIKINCPGKPSPESMQSGMQQIANCAFVIGRKLFVRGTSRYRG